MVMFAFFGAKTLPIIFGLVEEGAALLSFNSIQNILI